MALFPVYVFDAYGTLFDVHSAVGRFRDRIGPHADRMSDLWRSKQLEYTWVRTLMGAHRDFRALTAESLDQAAARSGVELSASLRAELLAAYEVLSAFPDVVPTLTALKKAGAKTAILSNGTPQMLEAATRTAGITDLLDACLSIESIGRYKTVPEVYALVTDRFGVSPDAVSFQSSNRWDVAGGVKFGFRSVWINRTGQPDEYPDLQPSAIVATLDGLLANDV